MSSEVDKYIKNAKSWQQEMKKLRSVLEKTKLIEEFKWKKPCYSYNGSNVAIIQPFKASLALMFFKGTLMKDSANVLVDNGPNSQAGRRFEFQSVQDITKLTPTIRAYVKEAIAIEESGKKVEFKKKPEPIPKELKEMFAKKPKLKAAFASLTPGRQRGYILHISSAKQSSTRTSRIEKCIPRILAGKGYNER